ncbi:MAG: YicC family protein [Clostridia bacterium]|nr:YicC family protein [Clostridia bacterium]
MFSMTGYGKAEYQNNGIDLIVEIKTVNNRNFDFNAKMPRIFLPFEGEARKIVSSFVSRARIDLFVSFSDKRQVSQDSIVDIFKAKSYYDASNLIAQELGIENDLSVSTIIRLPEVIADNRQSEDEFSEIFLDTVKKACEKLNEMRKTEGEKLVKDLLARMETIKELREKIIEKAPIVVSNYKEKLKSRIEEYLQDVPFDEARLLNEVAFFTDKVNIDEELTRLGSHVSQFIEIVKIDGMGKKLDFLMQEFNRETNTICSKSNDVEITNYALSLKNEIEKVREQVQNLE